LSQRIDPQWLARTGPAGLAYVANRSPSTGESTFVFAPHIEIVNDLIVQGAAGVLKAQGYKGAVVSMPPRHGKSFLVSHHAPAWFLGMFPDRHVGLASYETDFARSWGRKARGVLEEFGPELFNVEVDPSSRAAEEWRVRTTLKKGGELGSMLTAGIGGPFTGRGMHFLIIDDPVKNAQEAHSKVRRQAVWDWATSTAFTRLEPDAFILVIMTRWHEDDLAGRMLTMTDELGGWRFKHVNLAALALPGDPLGRAVGEALWPWRYPVEELAGIRRALGSYVWNSLYQGMPQALEGGVFDVDKIRIVNEMPGKVRRAVRFWDLAGSEEEEGKVDHTAGVLMYRLQDGKYVIVDVERTQQKSEGVEHLFQVTSAADGPNVKIRMEQERGAAGKLIVDTYRRMVPGHDVRGRRPEGDLELRARPLAAAVERGDVYALNGPWLAEFLEEVARFPHGAHDDQVSGAAGAFNELEKGAGAGAVSW
jgi:predicted phage terminase large subunit-like protein